MTDWVDGHAVRFVKGEAGSLYSAHRDEMSNETSGRAILARYKTANWRVRLIRSVTRALTKALGVDGYFVQSGVRPGEIAESSAA